MGYQEHKAPRELQHILHSFWSIDDLSGSEVHRVVPDGCSDIIFNIGKTHCSIPGESIGISGMMTSFFDVTLNSSTELLGLRFKPGQLNTLTSVPISEVKNLTVEASEFLPEYQNELLEQIAEADTISKKLYIIEKSLISFLHSKDNRTDSRVTHAVAAIQSSAGQIEGSALAYHLCMSLRQLERKFKEQVGLTIKEFSRIERFKYASNIVDTRQSVSLAEVAFNCGYYDHSHLTNEFRKLSGRTPSFPQ